MHQYTQNWIPIKQSSSTLYSMVISAKSITNMDMTIVILTGITLQLWKWSRSATTTGYDVF